MKHEQILSKIFTDRGFESRDYQNRNILNYINPSKPHVYAAGTAGGKTITCAAKLEFLTQIEMLKQNDRVIIIPSDKTILRRNFIKQFTKFFNKKKASFTWCSVEDKIQLQQAIDNKIQVIIVLPQFIKDYLKHFKNIKWLIVDEAHHWYFAPTIQRIITETKPKYRFLLTGTPFKFNAQKNNFIIDYTSIRELYSKNYIDDVNIQVLHTSLALTRLDWVSMTDNLKGDKVLTKKEINTTLSEVILGLVKKLKLPYKGLSSIHNITKNITSNVFGKLEKTIIFTHRTDAADVVGEYLKLHGVKCLVSHYKEDDEIPEETFKAFEEDDSIKVLVTVNRGKEGFDFPELYNIIDMTFSQNFEVVIQMIGRLMRKSNKKTYKVFYKVAPRHTASYFTDWMDCLIQLFDNYWYENFNGRNSLDVNVPNVLLTRTKGERQPLFINDGKKRLEISSGVSLTKGTKIQVIENNTKVPLKDGKYKVPQPPTKRNPKPAPVEIEVKNGIISKSTVRNTRGVLRHKNLETMGFDMSLSFMERNDWFRLDDTLSTVATTSLRKIMYKFNGSIQSKYKKQEIFCSYEECKKYAQSLNFTGARQWRQHKHPENIPSKPYDTYKDEWEGWGIFLGTNTIATYNIEYRDVEDAKKFVHKLKFNNREEWSEYCKSGKKPNDIPTAFWNVYNISTGEFLGTNIVATNNRVYLPYDKAQKIVSKMGFKNNKEYKQAYEKGLIPLEIPKAPDVSYSKKETWKGWSDFLGHNKYKRN